MQNEKIPIAIVEQCTTLTYDDEGYLLTKYLGKRLNVDVNTLPLGPLYSYMEDPEIVELKAALTLIMRAAEGAKVNCGSDPESPDAIRNGALASIAAVAAQGLGLLKGPKLSEGL